MRFWRRKNRRALILAFATMAVAAPTAQAGRILVDGGAPVATPSSSYYVVKAHQARVAMNELAVPSRVVRPDDRTGVRGPGATRGEAPQLVSGTNDGFSWRDAGIGGASLLAALLLLGSGLVLTRRRHGELAV
jgi:hypothetical protein